MNQAYIVHPLHRAPVKLCPRDEVAHPEKLVKIVRKHRRNWREIRIYDHMCYYIRGEYDRTFYQDVSSSHFYVLTDASSIFMFSDAESVGADDGNQMLEFLKKHAFTPFVITTPVLRLDTGTNAPDLHYSVPISHFHAPIYMSTGNTLELRDMIHSMCYTQCNGLILFLAMVRGHYWVPKVAYHALKEWNASGPIAADLTPLWQDLSTTHPVPMIADFPCYYATMNPPVPMKFMDLLYDEDTIPITQYVDDTDPEGPTCIYASPRTAMMPYLNKAVIDYYHPDLLYSNTNTMWAPPFDLEEEDIHMVDMEGMFLAILRSRRAWGWWKIYGPHCLRQASHTNQHTCNFAMHCLRILFYLYERPYPGMRYTRSRIRSIWNLVLEVLDISASDMRLLLSIISVRSLIYHKFGIYRWNPVFPVGFLVDVMNRYQDELDWFKVQNNHVYTKNLYDPTAIINLFSPYIQLMYRAKNEYYLTCSLHQLLSIEHTGAIFVKNVLEKRVAQKLLCMEKIFGLKKNPSILPVSEQCAYEVGTIMMDYFRTHRNELI